MAVHSHRSFRSRWISATCWAWLLACGVGWQQTTAQAQTPATSSEVLPGGIEIWRGNQRVSTRPSGPVQRITSIPEPVATPAQTPSSSTASVPTTPQDGRLQTLPPVSISRPSAPLHPVESLTTPVPTPRMTVIPPLSVSSPVVSTPPRSALPARTTELSPLPLMTAPPSPVPQPSAPVVVQPPVVNPVTVEPAPPCNSNATLDYLKKAFLETTISLATECKSALKTCAATVRVSGSPNKEALDSAHLPPSKPMDTVELKPVTKPAPAETPLPNEKRIDTQSSSKLELPDSWLQLIWIHLALAGCTILLLLIIVCVGLAMLFRRGWRVRVEMVHDGEGAFPVFARMDGNWPPGMVSPGVNPLSAADAMTIEPGSTTTIPPGEPELPFTGEYFDLGPSYEEERLAKAELLMQQEQAVMQEIFEQNLKLQRDLGRLPQAELPRVSSRATEDDAGDDLSMDELMALAATASEEGPIQMPSITLSSQTGHYVDETHTEPR